MNTPIPTVCPEGNESASSGPSRKSEAGGRDRLTSCLIRVVSTTASTIEPMSMAGRHSSRFHSAQARANTALMTPSTSGDVTVARAANSTVAAGFRESTMRLCTGPSIAASPESDWMAANMSQKTASPATRRAPAQQKSTSCDARSSGAGRRRAIRAKSIGPFCPIGLRVGRTFAGNRLGAAAVQWTNATIREEALRWIRLEP